jgi:hypothetical protein
VNASNPAFAGACGDERAVAGGRVGRACAGEIERAAIGGAGGRHSVEVGPAICAGEIGAHRQARRWGALIAFHPALDPVERHAFEIERRIAERAHRRSACVGG